MAANLDSDLLRTFVAIADSGSFTGAAKSVSRTQSAVSMQIKRLEETVGSALFVRAGRSNSLTADGESLLGYARRILRLQDQALARLANPLMAGRVRIGAPDDYVTQFMPGILARFAGSHPNVQVGLHCQPSAILNDQLDAGELDLAIVTTSPRYADSVAVRNEPVIWAASAAHEVHHESPLRLALFQPPCILREWALCALDDLQKPYRVAYVSPSQAGLFAAVQAGLAVTVLGRSWMPPGLRELGPVDEFPQLPNLGLTLERGQRERAPAVDVLADHIIESFAGAEQGVHAAPAWQVVYNDQVAGSRG